MVGLVYCNNDAVVVLPLPASISLDAHDVFVIAIYGIRLMSCGRRALDVGWLDYRPPFVIGHRLMSHRSLAVGFQLLSSSRKLSLFIDV